MTKNKTEIKAEPGKQELTITREFNASREIVFRAFTEPELVAQWLGPRILVTKIEAYDAKTTGNYRFTQFAPDGARHVFNGVFHLVVQPEFIIRTFEYEGLPERGHVSLETVRLKAIAEQRTLAVTHCVFQTIADRDGIIAAGMERGVLESYDRLDDLFISGKGIKP